MDQGAPGRAGGTGASEGVASDGVASDGVASNGVASDGVVSSDDVASDGVVARGADVDDDLLLAMSHELRAPLNAILGWAQLLRAGRASGPEAQRALEIIERNARLQARAVDDAIDLARIASGTMTMARASTRWSEALRPALAAAEPIARARDVRIEVEADAALRVTGDLGRLAQIARAMIASAVRRSVPGGRVQVALARRGAHATLTVREDRGAPEPAIDRRPVRPTLRRRREALMGDERGLAVAVARGLARLHGGTLEESSDGEALTARLPLEPAEGARADDARAAPCGGGAAR